MDYIVNPHDQYPPKRKDEWAIGNPPPKGGMVPVKTTTSTTLTLDTLFPNLDRWSIGFDPFFAALKAAAPQTKASSYPPYNITQTDDLYLIDIALAGFRKEEVEVELQARTLTVRSSDSLKVPTEKQLKEAGTKVLHQGIAKRAFTLNFALAEHIEVTQASFEDGMLLIVCKKEIPEELKPKQIAIQ